MNALADSNALRTQQREVSLLFADLRGFTELAAALEVDPLVCELLAHVMDCLTDAVIHHDGLVVDYYGDGLVAMWNAPADQPQHAELVCSAALEMLESLPAVAGDWTDLIHADLRLGIGIHTGNVQVGNAGSTRHVKYGPRGPNVHLASRVEAATKALQQPLVATTTTVRRLSQRFAANRICRALMPGLREPIDLYAVRKAAHDAPTNDAWQLYDGALRHFEQGRYDEAANILAAIETSGSSVPWRFLTDQVQRELGRQKRRRRTDQPSASRQGVIALADK